MILPLGKLVRYRTGLFAATVLAWMLASCLPLLTGLLTGAIFDGFVRTENTKAGRKRCKALNP